MKQDGKKTFELSEDGKKKFPDNAQLALVNGQALMKLQRLDEAEKAWEQFREKFPNLQGGYIHGIQTATRQGKHQKSLELSEDGKKKFPDNAQLALVNGQALMKLQRLDEAEKAWEYFREKFPQLAGQELFSKGQAYHSWGDKDKAIELYSRSIKQFQDFQPSYRAFAILAIQGLIAPARAELFYEQYLSRFPNDPSANLQLGKYWYHQQADGKRARQYFERSYELDPLNEDTLTSLIMLAFFQDKHKEVEQYSAELRAIRSPYQVPKSARGTCLVFPEKLKSPQKVRELLKFNSFQTSNRLMLGLSDETPKPNIVYPSSDQEFGQTKHEEQMIALFAYASPRPNLDVMHLFYQKLTDQGRNVRIFIKKDEVNDFDFSEINVEDIVFYAVDPSFFYKQQATKLIISNDMCGILVNMLPDNTKLLFHAPHNTTTPISSPHNWRSHYCCRLEKHPWKQGVFEAWRARLNFKTSKRVCHIPNSYTKNEVLFDFCNNFKTPLRIISFCPTTIYEWSFVWSDFMGNIRDAQGQYINSLVYLIELILDLFPKHSFVYRPFWGHPTHLLLTKPLAEKFAHEKRFLIDDYSNSKYLLAASEAMITDKSGMGLTFSDIKQIPIISYIHEKSEFRGALVAMKNAKICNSAEHVVTELKRIIGDDPPKKKQAAEKLPTEMQNLYGGISYLVRNLDYILNDKPHKDWHYYDMSV